MSDKLSVTISPNIRMVQKHLPFCSPNRTTRTRYSEKLWESQRKELISPHNTCCLSERIQYQGSAQYSDTSLSLSHMFILQLLFLMGNQVKVAPFKLPSAEEQGTSFFTPNGPNYSTAWTPPRPPDELLYRTSAFVLLLWVIDLPPVTIHQAGS